MEELTKQCPFCGQVINAAAIKCKYCGKWLEDPQPVQQEGWGQNQTPPPPPPPQPNYTQQQPNYNPQYTQQQPNYNQQPYYNPQYAQQPRKTNGLGIAGFIMALISLFVGWIPIIGWVLWFLGLLFSFIGVFKVPRGLAIAGLVISLLGLFAIIAVTGGMWEAIQRGIANLE